MTQRETAISNMINPNTITVPTTIINTIYHNINIRITITTNIIISITTIDITTSISITITSLPSAVLT